METNKIPFSIEEYIKDPTRKVVTRRGEGVRILCVDAPRTCYPVVGLVGAVISTWTKEGRYNPQSDSNSDIFFEPTAPTLNQFEFAVQNLIIKAMSADNLSAIEEAKNLLPYAKEVINPETLSEDEKNWKVVLGYVKDDALRVWLEKQKEKKSAEWSEEDEMQYKSVLSGLKYAHSHLVHVGSKESADIVSRGYTWFENRLKSIRPESNNIRWRRAKTGANIPESIILPDGEEPRFGKCAVRDSYYIPVEELKKLPKDE